MTFEENPQKGIGGIVVTYNPEPTLLSLVLDRLRLQVQRLVVIDNASADARTVERVGRQRADVYIENLTNVGLAAALNSGVSELRKDSEIHWVLLADQDSVLPLNYTTSLLGRLSGSGIQPAAVWVVRGAESCVTERPSHTRPREVETIRSGIMSGSLIRMAAFDVVHFREDFFVDLVDTDFYLSIGEHHGLCLRFPQVRFKHSIGRIINLKGRPTSFEASPRVFMIFCNGTQLILEGRFDRNLPWMMISSMIPLLYEEGARSTLKAMFGGLREGVVRGLRSTKGQALRM